MRKTAGKPLPLGVSVTKERVNFSVEAPQNESCELLLYKKGEKKPAHTIPMEEGLGMVRYAALEEIKPEEYEYNYRIGKEILTDPYAKKLRKIKTKIEETKGTRRKQGAPEEISLEQTELRGVLYRDDYDWAGDRRPGIPESEVVAYSLHVRGFTKHSSSKVKSKGTFAGVIEKIPYMQKLGVNQIHCMPVYEFADGKRYTNYWGYGPAYYFAPRSAYAEGGDGVTGLKDMVKACHMAGIEVVLEMPFAYGTSRIYMESCLRHYMLEYHVDGFILNPDVTPTDGIYEDPLLKGIKILHHRTDFQNVMRRFLKGDEGMVSDVIYWTKHLSQKEGAYNYITNHNGFTLCDLVSYDAKHNEMNGENNHDGPDYNFSWNCGAEGPSRKKTVTALRKNQMYNAFFLVLLSQGTPCILAGDEFANSQKGNNNVYCQDNPISWLDWSKLEREQALFSFVKELIHLRKSLPALHQTEELTGLDRTGCGVPDVSYHGEYAWQTPSEVSSRQLGVFYCGRALQENDCFVAYNMHWVKHSFALPALPKGKRWHLAADTKRGIAADLGKAEALEDQREAKLEERTIAVFVAK